MHNGDAHATVFALLPSPTFLILPPLRRCAPVYELHVAGDDRWGLPFKVSLDGGTEHYQWSSSRSIASCTALGEGVREDIRGLLQVGSD